MSKQTKKPTIGAHAGTGRYHTYNVGLAIDLNDTTAAIVFHHVEMNIERLVENGKVDEDGVAWLTVSKSGIMRFLCELSKSQIETAINKLTENKLLVKKVSNFKNSYTLSDLGWSYYPMLVEEGSIKAPKADAEEAKSAEKESDTTKPIDKVSDIAKEVIEYVNKKAGKHFDYAPSYCRNIDCLVKAGFTKEDMFVVVDYKYEELSGTNQFHTGMNPSKLFFAKTFPNFLNSAKGSDITMSAEQLARDAKEKEEYHLKQAELCKCEKIILGTGSCDNLPFDLTTDANTEEMMHDRARKQRYHLSEAKKFRNMAKLIKAQSVK